METPSVYIVVDIETDGPVPSRHAMRSLSAVVIVGAGKELGIFQRTYCRLKAATLTQTR